MDDDSIPHETKEVTESWYHAARSCLVDDGLSVRAAHVLINLYAVTPEKAAEFTEIDLMREPNCGPVTITEIKRWLSRHGLMLRDDRPRCPHCHQLLRVEHG